MAIRFSLTTQTLSIAREAEVGLIELAGNINMNSVDELNRHFEKAIETGIKYFVVVMHGVESIKSTGIGSLIGFSRQVGEIGGTLKLAELPDNITQVFTLLSLHDALKIYETRAEAIDSFREHFTAWDETLRRLESERDTLGETVARLEARDRTLHKTNAGLQKKLAAKNNELKAIQKELERLRAGLLQQSQAIGKPH